MLYIIKNRYFLTDYILDGLDREDVTVVRIDRGKRNLWVKIVRFYDVLMKHSPRKSYFGADFLNAISAIGEDDRVLFFGVENQKDLIQLGRFIKAKVKFAWLWNSLFSVTRGVFGVGNYGDSLRGVGIEAYTFDEQDAKDHGFKQIGQVYRADSVEMIGRESDVFFVGYDKGRLECVAELAERLKKEGLKVDFRVVKDRTTVGESEYLSEEMKYEDVLNAINGSKAVLDIVQSGQRGQTLRPLEAMFAQRKLITNNKDIVNEPFYSKERVFILGVDKETELKRFIESDFKPVEREILNRYEINHWIEQFL